MKRTFSGLVLLLSIFFASAQNKPVPQKPKDKAPSIFTEEDWNKLSQHDKDSINKKLFEEYKSGNESAAKVNEERANEQLDEALKNAAGTTTLVIDDFPRAKLNDNLTQLKNLEEFTCNKCKALDLDVLFNQLAKLPKLKKVNLAGGAYSVLPGSVGTLVGLEELNLKDDNFKTLPEQFTALAKLKVLNLQHNAYLYDEDVYDRLKNMNVEVLNLSASGLLQINNKIGSVKSLKALDISINGIKALPVSFSQLTSLQKINISQNFEIDFAQVISLLVQIPSITEIEAQECGIDNLPMDISKFSNLRLLNVRGNRISTLPITFSGLTNLEYLDLGYLEMGTRRNKLTELSPGFGNLKKLRYLNLAGNSIQTLPDGFSGLTELEDLNLRLNKLPGFPQSVAQLKKLKNLDLGLNEASSIPVAVGNLTSLESLNLDGNFFARPDKKIKTLPADICKLINLKTLSLKDNVIEQLPECISSLTKLEKLDLRDNLLTNLPLSFIQLKNLKWLDLKANDIGSLPTGFETLNQLTEFNFSMNTKMNFAVEKTKFEKMTQLRILDLSYNNITKTQITPLRTALPNCKVINIDYKK